MQSMFDFFKFETLLKEKEYEFVNLTIGNN